MNGRVIFFPLKHIPSDEKKRELLALQERLHYYRIEFLNTIKRESEWQRAMAHARLKNRTRELIRIVKDDRSEGQTCL